MIDIAFEVEREQGFRKLTIKIEGFPERGDMQGRECSESETH